MRLFSRLFTVTLLLAPCVCPQDFTKVGLSIGVKGGFPLTDSLRDTNTPPVFATGLTSFEIFPAIHSYSDAKNFVVGPTVELRLPLHFSFEADGLYRPQNVTQVLTFTVPSPPAALRSSRDNSSWEISLLGKFTLPSQVLKPYVAAGPTFRVLDNGLRNYFSSKGVAAAAGVSFTFYHLHFGPELRFTHWGNDPAAPPAGSIVLNPLPGSPVLVSLPAIPTPIRSRRNQSEFLLGLSF